MDDLVLVTADSVRHDFVEEMPFVSDHEVARGVAGGHYTRPSLSSLVSAQQRAALQARAASPTIAEVLADEGYTCIGLAPSAQTDEYFGFGRGFDYFENFKDPGNRGSRRREILSRITLLRKLYHRVVPPHAKQDDLPDDDEVVDEAVERFNDANPPRFLWVHLMESHRPYGTGDDAVSKSLDRKAIFSPNRLTDADREEILDRYRRVLGRVDEQVRRLWDEVKGDPVFAFTSDHGDEFGEEGYYFHQPQRRRVADALIEVPVVGRNVAFERSTMSLLDLPPTLLAELGVEIPDAWDGVPLERKPVDHTVTIAPWGEQASVAVRTPRYKLVSSDASVTIDSGEGRVSATDEEIPDDIQRQLEDLGYVE